MHLLSQKHAGAQSLLANELGEIRRRFAQELKSDLACVNDLAGHLEQYRGKMLRPTLVLLAGVAAAPDRPLTEAHRAMATVVEMVHMATLVHDDVLDESEVRRRGSTINHLRGNETAVMLGDYLISHAYHLCTKGCPRRATRILSRATNTVCEGEMLQLSRRNDWNMDEKTYLDMIRRKTASLCSAGCRLGAMLAGADVSLCRALSRYGANLGMAFQIVDDLLDLSGDQAVVGKDLGKDLEKGKPTLALIHRLAHSQGPERDSLLQVLRQGGAQGADRLRQILSQSDSMAYARAYAESLIGKARQALEVLPESDARTMLGDLAEAVVSREY